MSCPAVVRVLVPGGPAVVRVVTPGPPGTSTGGGAALSDEDPLPVATVADPGDSEEASRANHQHALPAGQTLLAATDKIAWDAAASRVAQLGEDDSPTFAGLTVTGTAIAAQFDGNLTGAVGSHCRNVSGVALAALTPLCVTGSQGDTTILEVVAAHGDTPGRMPAAGLALAALGTSGSAANGHLVGAGVIAGVNTAGFTSGAPLFVAPAGGITATRPTTGLVQVVAVVGRVHAITGTVVVSPGPALSLAAFSGAYGDLSGRPTLVSSINGQTGVVTLGTGDLGESGGNLFFTAARAIGSALTGFAAGAGTVAATDSILQAINKIVGNIAGRALTGLIASSGLTMNPNRLAGRISAGVGTVEEVTPTGGMVLIDGNLVPGEIVKLVVSNIGETGITTGNFKNETRIDRPFTLLGLWWNCHPTAMGSASTSDARPYIRTGAGTTSAGTKTNILTTTNNIASLATSVHTVDATSSINGGEISGSAGDWLGADLMSVGTGSSGHFLTFILRYS